jgi:hypothetical protein
MTRPKESDYTSQTAYTRALEDYTSGLESVLQKSHVAIDEITDKIDGTGFNSSTEFDYCLEVLLAIENVLP